MARQRSWGGLSDRTRKSYLNEGAKRGMSPGATESFYSNSSNNLGILRRHVTKSGRRSPEHPEEAARHPERYRGYSRRGNPDNTMLVIGKRDGQTVEVPSHNLSMAERRLVGEQTGLIRDILESEQEKGWENIAYEKLHRLEGTHVGEGSERIELETSVDNIESYAQTHTIDFENRYPERSQ